MVKYKTNYYRVKIMINEPTVDIQRDMVAHRRKIPLSEENR